MGFPSYCGIKLIKNRLVTQAGNNDGVALLCPDLQLIAKFSKNTATTLHIFYQETKIY